MLLYFYLKILVIHHSTVQVIVTDSHDSHSSILWCQLFNKVTLRSDVQFHQTTKCSSVDDPLYTLCYASQNTVVVTIQDIQHQLRIKLYPVKTGTVPHLVVVHPYLNDTSSRFTVNDAALQASKKQNGLRCLSCLLCRKKTLSPDKKKVDK